MLVFSKTLLPAFALFSATTQAAAIITASDIVSGIAAVDSAVVAFREHIIAYNGGYLNETHLFTDLASILTITTFLDTQSTLLLSNFTPADSARLVAFYTSSLGADVPSTGKALLAKRDLIVGMGEGESVALAQKTFQTALEVFAGDVERKLTDEVGDFERAREGIYKSLQEGFEAFNAVSWEGWSFVESLSRELCLM